ncbi:hypothetical protein TCAL_12464, partial [Tigriopus californicus]
VCRETSEQPFLSYGVKVCHSCRAFFRRIFQDPSSSQKLKCKGSGQCAISVKTRRICQRCRLTKCLTVGMNPNLVMNVVAKKERFRNAFQHVYDSNGVPQLVWRPRRTRGSSTGSSSPSSTSPSRVASSDTVPMVNIVLKAWPDEIPMEDNYSNQIASDLYSQLADIFQYFPLPPVPPPSPSFSLESLDQAKLSQFTEGFREISLGEEYIKEFLMYSLDVPLSRQFVPQTMKTFAARYINALRSWDEFRLLTGQDQHDLLKRNLYKAVALSVAKACRIPNGEGQLMFIVGQHDQAMIQEHYWGLFDVQKLKSLRMGDINQKTMALSEDILQDYNRLVDSVSNLVEDFQTFQLISLVMLFADFPQEAHYRAMLETHLRVQNGDLMVAHALNCSGRHQIEALSQIIENIPLTDYSSGK